MKEKKKKKKRKKFFKFKKNFLKRAVTPLRIFIFSKNPPSSAFRVAMYCGDLGINRKNSQPDIDSSAARYKMYKCVATHKAPRIHPVKIKRKKNDKM